MKLQQIDNLGTLRGFVLVRMCEKKQTKNGGFYLDMTIYDGENDYSAKCWDFKGPDENKPKPNSLILVKGTLGTYNNQPQFRVERFRNVLESDDVNISDFIPSASFEGEDMFREILSFVENFEDEELKKLAFAVLNDYKEKIIELPAAFRLHHAIRGGLLMHTLSICRLAQAVACLYPSVDADLLLCGVILHDVAKSEEFSLSPAGLVDGYTVPGTLIGHLVKGAMIIEEIGKREEISDNTRMLIEHMLLSHHGIPDYGAAVRPLFLEAEILSALDTLDADIYEIESTVKDITPGAFSNKVWALEDRKFLNHGRKKTVTDVDFNWRIEKIIESADETEENEDNEKPEEGE
ncbi:MAG: HD domain-containing protein [Clostridia bacterium]|nr:HD domain-containing protein [Clostridia bacterium]